MNDRYKVIKHQAAFIGLLILAVILIVWVIWHWVASDKASESLVILTGSSISRTCDSNTSGRCLDPNKEDVLARFRFPKKYLAINEERGSYYRFVALRLNMTSTTISEVKSFDGGLLMSGGKVMLRNLRPWKDSLRHHMETSMFFAGEGRNYQKVPSEIPGTVKYDDTNCIKFGLDKYDGKEIEKLGLETVVKNRCFSFRRQYYWWENYPHAYVSCPRIEKRNGREISLSCDLVSLITPDLIAFYSMEDELVRDSSWIVVDKKIRKFFLSHIVEEG